jgi:hypothetical protein
MPMRPYSSIKLPTPSGNSSTSSAMGYDILLDTGVNIQPWVFDEASLVDPEHYPAPHLVAAIR